MANPKTLTMAGKAITSTAQAQMLGRKGGLVSSPKKKFAAKLREMKKRGVTNADQQWFLDRITDSETNIFHLQEWLDKLREHIPPERQRTLLDTAIQLHKAHHGEKVKTESKNLNFNITTDVETFQGLLNKYEKDEEVIDI